MYVCVICVYVCGCFVHLCVLCVGGCLYVCMCMGVCGYLCVGGGEHTKWVAHCITLILVPFILDAF